MVDWCNDCAWPVECAAVRGCHRRDQGEVRAAALPEEADVLRAEVARQTHAPLKLDRHWADGRVQPGYAVLDGDAA